MQIIFDFKSEELKLDKVENSAFLFAIPDLSYNLSYTYISAIC